MNKALDIYLNLNTNEVELGNERNWDDEYTQLSVKNLLDIIDDFEYWDDLDQKIYDELFEECNIDLEKYMDETGFYDIDNVINEVREIALDKEK